MLASVARDSLTTKTAFNPTATTLAEVTGLLACRPGRYGRDGWCPLKEAAFASIVPTWDTREGLTAFLEKRSASYRGQ
jgi:hypothetical protein